MDNNTQLDFAVLALKGKRYQEAENIYMQIATSNSSSEAWLGIGICKLYQLTEGKTMDEVIFCFNKAKSISPQLVHDLNNQLMLHTLLVLKTYAQLIEAASVKHQEARKAAQTGALLAGLSIAWGMASNSTFSTVASLAGTGAGVGVAVESLSAMSDYNTLIKQVLVKCNEAYLGVSSFVDTQAPEYLQFENNVNSIIGYVEKALKNSSNKRSTSTGLSKYLMAELDVSMIDQFKLMQAILGIHKFREGNIKLGFLYLLSLGGLGILARRDMIKMISDEYEGYNLLQS